jgi:hypothetical protein
LVTAGRAKAGGSISQSPFTADRQESDRSENSKALSSYAPLSDYFHNIALAVLISYAVSLLKVLRFICVLISKKDASSQGTGQIARAHERIATWRLRASGALAFRVSPLQCPFWARLSGRADKKIRAMTSEAIRDRIAYKPISTDRSQAGGIAGFASRGHGATNGNASLQAQAGTGVYLPR